MDNETKAAGLFKPARKLHTMTPTSGHRERRNGGHWDLENKRDAILQPEHTKRGKIPERRPVDPLGSTGPTESPGPWAPETE